MSDSAIKHTELFDFDAYKASIVEVEKLTISFANSIKQLSSTLQAEFTTLKNEVNGYKKSVSEANDIDNLKKLDTQLEKTSERFKTVKENVDNANKSVKVAEDSMQGLTNKAKQLEDEYKSLSAAERENKAVVDPLIKSIKDVSSELTLQKKILSDAKKNTDTVTNSYAGLSKNLTDMKNQLKNMPNAFDKNTGALNKGNKEAVALAKNIENSDKALKKMDAGMGVYTRNVGNYSSAFEALPTPLSNAVSGVQNVRKSFLALLANPIVAFVAAIVGVFVLLYKAFTSTDSGATEMAARFEQLSAIIDVFRQRIVGVANGLIEFFKGNWQESTEAFKEAFTGISAQLKDATKAAYEYAYAVDKLNDSEDNYISKRAENANKIAKLEFEAANKENSVEKRREFLKEALKISEEEVLQEKKFADDKLNNELNYLAAKSDSRNKVTAKEIKDFLLLSDEEQKNAKSSIKLVRENNEDKFKQLEELYAKTIDADTKYFSENKRNISKLSGFEEEIRKAKLEATEKATKEAYDIETKYKNQLEKDLQDEKDFYTKLLKEKADANAKLDKEKEDREEKIYQKKKTKSEVEAKEELERAIELENKKKEAKEEIQKASFDGAVSIANSLFEIQKINIQANIDNLTNEKDVAIQSLTDKYNADIEAAGNNAAAKKQIEKRYLRDKATEETKFNNQIKDQKRQAAEAERNAALFNIAINLAESISSIWAKWGELPYVAGALTAISVGVAGAQAAVVASQPLPRFEKGTENAPEGLAIVNDGSGSNFQEMIIRKDKAYLPTKRNQIVNLQKGDKVKTAFETQNILKTIDNAAYLKNQSINDSLSVTMENARMIEVKHLISSMKIDEKLIGQEVGKRIAEMPQPIQIWNEKGYQEYTRQKNTLKNNIKKQNSLV